MSRNLHGMGVASPSTFLFIEALWLKILLTATAVLITLYLLSLPIAAPEDQSDRKGH